MAKLKDTFSELARNGEKSISFEFFPPSQSRVARDGLDSMFYRIAEMGERLKPTFISVTWRSDAKDETTWLKLGSMIQKQLGIDVVLHLTCSSFPRTDLIRILKNVRAAGIRNILALRGDAARLNFQSKDSRRGSIVLDSGTIKRGSISDYLQHAIELVRLIREEHGDYFSIGVAGYPEVHLSCWNSKYLPPSEQARELDLIRLKDKVDAGADFVITQFFYDPKVLTDFVKRCRDFEIHVPIIPGYAPIQNYESYQKFISWVKPTVPVAVEEQMARIHGNDEEVHTYGITLGVEQCHTILQSDAPGIHFFTLNLAQSVASILRKLGLRKNWAMDSSRELPFKGLIRASEQIRPIFWSNRYSSYLSRTLDWKEFPHGRWGDSRETTFQLQDYYLEKIRHSVDLDLMNIWGMPQNAKDVSEIFVRYMRGEIDRLPWCDEGLALETEAISDSLCWINAHGFLTINSQPKVNGAPSDDERYGWGGPNGYCFQKAYVEFFCTPESWEKLKLVIDEKYHNRLTYHAINLSGTEHGIDANQTRDKKMTKRTSGQALHRSDLHDSSEVDEQNHNRQVNAVTWGVFPDREIIQPTVVDTASFRVWKDEAFELWLSSWAALYRDALDDANSTADDIDACETKQAKINAVKTLTEIHDTWFLVNIVDNDYVSETNNIFEVFKAVILNEMSPDELRDRVNESEKRNALLRRELLQAKSEIEKYRKLLGATTK